MKSTISLISAIIACVLLTGCATRTCCGGSFMSYGEWRNQDQKSKAMSCMFPLYATYFLWESITGD